MTTPEERHRIGAAVRALRTNAVLDSIQLGNRSRVAASHLRNIEAGRKRLTPSVARVLDTALNTGGILQDLANTTDPARRRHLLRTITLMTTTPMLVPTDHRPAKLGELDIELIHTLTTSLRAADNRHGGGSVHTLVTYYLDDLARPLLAASMTSTIRRHLRAALAELGHLAAWTAYDSGLHALARRHFEQAHAWAIAAGHVPLTAEIITARAHQANFLGRHTEAVALAETALATANRVSASALAAGASLQAAHAHALAGDAQRSARALLSAEHLLDRADHSSSPAWGAYMGTSYVEALRGHALVVLGDAGAVQAAESSLRMDDRYARGRMFNLALWARALIVADQPEAAVEKGFEALVAAEGLRSARASDYLRRIVLALGERQDVPGVAQFAEAVGARLASL